MKIDVSRIPPEGRLLEEAIAAGELDLETENVRFLGPLMVRAEVSKITNAITIDLTLSASVVMRCSRCLLDFKDVLQKTLKLNYMEDEVRPLIDLNPEIREEVILDYPIKPLCRPDCLGLCSKCGKNLNEGKCACGKLQ